MTRLRIRPPSTTLLSYYGLQLAFVESAFRASFFAQFPPAPLNRIVAMKPPVARADISEPAGGTQRLGGRADFAERHDLAGCLVSAIDLAALDTITRSVGRAL